MKIRDFYGAPGRVPPIAARQIKGTAFRLFAGRFANSVAVASAMTFETQFTLPPGVIPQAIKIIFSQGKNATGNTAAPTFTAKMAQLAQRTNAFADVVGYQNILSGGSTSITLPAAGAAGRRSYLVSDWRYLAQTPRTDVVGAPYAFVVRVLMPTQADPLCLMGNGSTDTYSGWASESTGRFFQMRQATGDYVTSASGFNGVATTSIGSPIAGYIVMAQNGQMYTILGLGDSNVEGRELNLTGRGFPFQAAMALSPSDGMAVEYACLGWSSAGSQAWLQNLTDLIGAGLIPDMMVMPLGTGNDVPTQTTTAASQIQLTRYYQNQIKELASTNLITQVDVTWQPYNTSSYDYTTISDGVTIDSQRVAKNVADLAQPGNRIIYDLATDVSGVTTNGQVQLATTIDGTHLDTVAIAKTIPGLTAAMKRAQPLLA